MRYLLLMVLATVLIYGGCDGDSRGTGGSDSDADTDSDTDTDADTDTDSDSDTDTDTECACSPQQPETFGDCNAGEDIEPTVTEIVETTYLDCSWYFGPTEPSAAAEVDFFAEYNSGYTNSFAVFKGDVGWDDFKTVCMAANTFLTEDDFPEIDFSSQRAVFFTALYKYDCYLDGTGLNATRIGDLYDSSVQINGYLYSTGTEIDCELDGFGWYYLWVVVLDTTSEIRTCLELAVFPPA